MKQILHGALVGASLGCWGRYRTELALPAEGGQRSKQECGQGERSGVAKAVQDPLAATSSG